MTGDVTGSPHAALFWKDGDYQAVLKDGWKLQVSGLQDKVWLYDLNVDPTERTDLSMREPAKLAELKAALAAHVAEQAPPAWPSVTALPVYIDKTLADDLNEDDEFVYWQN